MQPENTSSRRFVISITTCALIAGASFSCKDRHNPKETLSGRVQTTFGSYFRSSESKRLAKSRSRIALVAAARLPNADWTLEFLGIDQELRERLYRDTELAALEFADNPYMAPRSMTSVQTLTSTQQRVAQAVASAWHTSQRMGEALFLRALAMHGQAYIDKCNMLPGDHLWVLSDAQFDDYLGMERAGVCRDKSGQVASSGWSPVSGALSPLPRFNATYACFDALMDAVQSSDKCVGPLTQTGGEGADASGGQNTNDNDNGNDNSSSGDNDNGSSNSNDNTSNSASNDNASGGSAGNDNGTESGNGNTASSVPSSQDVADAAADEDRQRERNRALTAPDPEPKERQRELPDIFNYISAVRVSGDGFYVRFKFKFDCVAFSPASEVTTPYAVRNADRAFQSKGPPNAFDAFQYCLCQAMNGQFSGLRCHDEEDRKKMDCLANPWGPDDAPRRECLDILRGDGNAYADEYCRRWGQRVYCPADDITVMVGESRCGCMSGTQAVGGYPSNEGCAAIMCEPGVPCRCDARMRCQCVAVDAIESSGPVRIPTRPGPGGGF